MLVMRAREIVFQEPGSKSLAQGVVFPFCSQALRGGGRRQRGREEETVSLCRETGRRNSCLKLMENASSACNEYQMTGVNDSPPSHMQPCDWIRVKTGNQNYIILLCRSFRCA